VNLLRKINGNALIKDSFWAIFGNIVLRGLSVVSGIFVARLLGSDSYGVFTTLKGLLLTVTVFSTMGLGYSATKFFAEYLTLNRGLLKSLYRYIIKITILFSAIIALILFASSDWYAKELLKDESLSFSVKVLAISIVFNALSFTQIGVISGLKKFKELSILNVVIGILSFVITLILSYFWGFEGSIYSLLGTSLVNYIANEIFLNRTLNHNEHSIDKVDRNLKRLIMRETFPVALQEISFTLASWLSSILLIKYSNYTDVANYNIAMQWNAIILFIPGALRNVILSHLSINSNEKEKRRSVMKQTILINLISTGIPAIFVLLFASFIVALYGTAYSGLKELITVALFITIPMSISNVFSQAFMTINKNWLMFSIRAIRDILTILIFILLTKSDLVTAPIAMLYSSLVCSTITLLVFIKIYNSKLANL
jgi:O-antigen/teichoic acid export membrane protein